MLTLLLVILLLLVLVLLFVPLASADDAADAGVDAADAADDNDNADADATDGATDAVEKSDRGRFFTVAIGTGVLHVLESLCGVVSGRVVSSLSFVSTSTKACQPSQAAARW